MQVTEPAPRITVSIATHTGTKEVSDLGADISAAGTHILEILGYHPFNLQVIPNPKQ